MKRNCVLHLSLYFVAGTPGGDATRKVRRVCGEASFGLLDDNQILHGFNPACLRMLFNVPGATSSPGLPATVTSPGLVACLNCRCDPRCRTTDQPSSSSILTTSRIFTMRSTPRSLCVREQPSAHAARSTPLSHDVPSSTNLEASLPLVAATNAPSPPDWAQMWAHEFSGAANRWRISTIRGRPACLGRSGSQACPPQRRRRRVRISERRHPPDVDHHSPERAGRSIAPRTFARALLAHAGGQPGGSRPYTSWYARTVAGGNRSIASSRACT
jgi:hypothetical protein